MNSKNGLDSLSIRQKIAKGEYMEDFLKKRGLWKTFQNSSTRKRYQNENLAFEMFIKDEGLWTEFTKLMNKRAVAIKLGGREKLRDRGDRL